MRLLRLLTDNRFWPLFMKELRQIKRNRKLVVMLVMPPTLNLVLLGFAMNSEVNNVRLGVVDESRTAESRELVSAFVESGAFQIAERFESSEARGRARRAGRPDAGLDVLYPNLLALAAFTFVIVGASVWRFRKQLS